MAEQAAVDVIETELYDLLGVAPDAAPQDIKKAYRILALRYHPDKNSDADAEEKFKEVGQAYVILSDLEKRKAYNLHGKEYVLKVSTEEPMDPQGIFRELFGGGLFHDYIGELNVIELMELSTAVDKTAEEQKDATREKAARMQEADVHRVEGLAEKLVARCAKWTEGDKKAFELHVTEEASELSETPGGSALCELIGYVYRQEARQHMERWLGLQKVFSEIGEKTSRVGNTLGLVRSAVMAQAYGELAAKQKKDTVTASDKGQDTHDKAEELVTKALASTMKMVWRMGKIEIDETLRRVCEKVMADPNKSKSERLELTEGIEQMGIIFERVGAETRKEELVILAGMTERTLEALTIRRFMLVSQKKGVVKDVDFTSQALLSAMRKVKKADFMVEEGDVIQPIVELCVNRPINNVHVKGALCVSWPFLPRSLTNMFYFKEGGKSEDLQPREEPYIIAVTEFTVPGPVQGRGQYVLEVTVEVDGVVHQRLQTLFGSESADS